MDLAELSDPIRDGGGATAGDLHEEKRADLGRVPLPGGVLDDLEERPADLRVEGAGIVPDEQHRSVVDRVREGQDLDEGVPVPPEVRREPQATVEFIEEGVAGRRAVQPGHPHAGLLERGDRRGFGSLVEREDATGLSRREPSREIV